MNSRIDWDECVKNEGRRQLYRALSYIIGEELHRAALRIVEERGGGYFHIRPFDDDDDDQDRVYDKALRDLDVEYVREIFFETADIRDLNPKLVDFDKALAELRDKWGDKRFRDGESLAAGPAVMRSMNAAELYSREFYSEADAVSLARGRVDRRLLEVE